MAHPIPGFYRALFAWIDPFMSIVGGMIPCLVAPDMLLEGYMPASMLPRNRLYDVIFHQLAAAFFFVGTSQAILLRLYDRDVRMWRVLNGLLAGWDVLIVYGVLMAWKLQGRLNLGMLRGHDLSTLGITLFIGLARVAIAAGVGIRTGERGAVVKTRKQR